MGNVRRQSPVEYVASKGRLILSRNATDLPAGGTSLAEMIAQVDARLDVLRPFVREFEQLGMAREALAGGVSGSPAPARSRRERPSAPRRARRAPRGANREAIVKVAGSRPGVTVAEIADKTGIGKPTVYSTVYSLKRRGVLEAQGEGVRLAGARAQPAGAAPARSGAARRSTNARGTP